MSDSECVSRAVAAVCDTARKRAPSLLRKHRVRSGKHNIVERQNVAPNAKFCLCPLRPPTEEGANVYSFDLSVPKLQEVSWGARGASF